MEPTISTYLIICPVCFLVGILNSTAGGGGLIALPAMLLVGLPPHMAIATNKTQAILGLAVANYRYIKAGLIKWRLAIPIVLCGVLFSFIGSNTTLQVGADYLYYLMFIILPIMAFLIFRPKTFSEENSDDVKTDVKTIVRCCLLTCVIAFYDGFYGPGAAMLFLLMFAGVMKFGTRAATAQAKLVALCTNTTAVIVFLINGQVLIPLALAAGVCDVIGSWLGAGMVMKNGAKIIKPLVVLAFILLVVKLVVGF